MLERNYFYVHPGKILKTMPRIVSKIGATLKGKNLLSEGANAFLYEQPYGKETNILCLFICVEILRPSQPNGVMSSVVSLPSHTFTGQA